MLIEEVAADLAATDVATLEPTIKGNTVAEGTEVGTSRRQLPREGIVAFHRTATIAIVLRTSAGTTTACSTAATASSAGTEGWVLPSWEASPG